MLQTQRYPTPIKKDADNSEDKTKALGIDTLLGEDDPGTESTNTAEPTFTEPDTISQFPVGRLESTTNESL